MLTKVNNYKVKELTEFLHEKLSKVQSYPELELVAICVALSQLVITLTTSYVDTNNRNGCNATVKQE